MCLRSSPNSTRTTDAQREENTEIGICGTVLGIISMLFLLSMVQVMSLHCCATTTINWPSSDREGDGWIQRRKRKRHRSQSHRLVTHVSIRAKQNRHFTLKLDERLEQDYPSRDRIAVPSPVLTRTSDRTDC